MFLITQSESLLSKSVSATIHYRILGRVSRLDREYVMTKKLWWNPDSGHMGEREFFYMDETEYARRFKPLEAACVVS